MGIFTRCTSCGAEQEMRDDAAGPAPGTLDWTCARCGARDTWEIVKRPAGAPR